MSDIFLLLLLLNVVGDAALQTMYEFKQRMRAVLPPPIYIVLMLWFSLARIENAMFLLNDLQTSVWTRSKNKKKI